MPSDTVKEPERGTGVDFLKRLPNEIGLKVLGYFKPKEWRQLRFVSKQWNQLCLKLVWRKVLVGPYDSLGTANNDYYADSFFSAIRDKNFYRFHDRRMIDDYERFEQEGPSLPDSYMLLSHEQLNEQSSNPLFLEAIRNVTELFVMYGYHEDTKSENESVRAYGAMTEVFNHVPKVTVHFLGALDDDRFQSFQAMLNKWKPSTAFSLGVFLDPYEDEECIDINGMNIVRLSVFKVNNHKQYLRYHDKRELGEDREIQLKKNGRVLRWSELSSLGKTLHTLTLEVNRSELQSLIVPETVKYLRIANIGTAKSPLSAKVKIPCGVEYLAIADECDNEGTEGEPVALDCIDLSEARKVKWFRHDGPTTDQLVRAVRDISSTLKFLALGCNITEPGFMTFTSLAGAATGIRQLQLSIESFLLPWLVFGHFMQDCPGRLHMKTPDGEDIPLTQLEDEMRLLPEWKVVGMAVAGFLVTNRNLRRVLLDLSKKQSEWVQTQKWIVPLHDDQAPYEVDFRELMSVMRDARTWPSEI